MSAQPVEEPTLARDDVQGGTPPELANAPDQVEVRRNAVVPGVIGAAASAMGIAYLWRAANSGALLDWALCLLLGAMAVGFLRSLLDSRTPLLVADEMGVRVRLGAQWRGLPWEAIDRVVVKPRQGLLHDGRLVVTLYHVQRAVEGLEGRAARHVRLNQRLYGAALAVPLGLTTRVAGGDASEDLGDRVAALSQGRTEVVTLLDEPGVPVSAATRNDVPADERPVIEDDSEPVVERRPRWLRRTADAVAQPEPEPDVEAEVQPLSRVFESAVEAPSTRVIDALNPVGESSSKVRAIAKLGEPVAPLVISEFEPQPAYDPVIGPELAAARTRVGLSVDQLAERTRIRPHVIESIEVDDFAPCGGDFYARGHIRTLARVLGKDPEPMLTHFEDRYATAPVNARRVFEAELATGMGSGLRPTAGGPNWALLIGVVLALILVWSAMRLFSGTDEELLHNPAPVLNGSAGLRNGYGAPNQTGPQPVSTRLTAGTAGTHVVVRDGDGALVFEGDLVIGATKTVSVDPPVTITADNGGALSVAIAGQDQGVLGAPDQPATKVFQRPGR